MKDAMQTTRFRFWLWLIGVIGLIVPRRLRADWRQEWEAAVASPRSPAGRVGQTELAKQTGFVAAQPGWAR